MAIAAADQSAMLALPEEDLGRALAMLPESVWRQLAGQRIFMTGGTGFVGKWLLASLLYANRRLGLECQVTVLSRSPEAFMAAAPDLAAAPELSLMQGDVRDLHLAAPSFDTIIHAATDVAAQASGSEIFLTCVEGTRRVLDLACECKAKNLLLVSSGAVYGQQPADMPGVPESYSGAPDPLLPSSAYGEGKRAAEWLACAQGAESGLQVKVGRCFAFVGPHLPLDKHFAIGNFLRAALAGEELLIQGDGTPQRSYLYAADMAAWLWAVLLRGRAGVAYNVGADESVSIAELAQRVCKLLQVPASIRTLKAAEPGKPALRYVPDVRRAREELGLPAALPLDDAIMRTARWHRRQQA